MLKIKADVDLKILTKKHKFKLIQQNMLMMYIRFDSVHQNWIGVVADKDIIGIQSNLYEERQIVIRAHGDDSVAKIKIYDILYDLIEAGIVEKVKRRSSDE